MASSGVSVRLVDPAHYEQLKASGRLPSPEGVAYAIIKLLQQEDYKVEDLVRLVQSDPAIAGRLLKFANSAALGANRPSASLPKAVLALGAFRVRDLVLGFSVLHRHRDGSCPGFDYPAFWSRSLATGIAAQALATYSQVSEEESFTAGLLCDVGELALASLSPERYGQVIESAAGDIRKQVEGERAAFGTDHRELGATMMAEWGLPEILVTSAYHSEAPDEAGFSDGSRYHVLALSLHFARTLARICVSAEAQRWAMVPELFNKAARLGINPDELTSLADKVAERWHEWGHALRIDTQDLPPFAELLSATPPAGTAGRETAEAEGAPAALVIGQGRSSIIPKTLGAAGYRVLSTPDVGNGLVVALRENPALILIDLSEASDDGTMFCRSCRESSLGRDSYIILIGDRKEEKRLLQGIEAGADDFLLRPVTENILRARLRTAAKTLQLRGDIQRERRNVVRTAHEWAGTHRRLMEVAMTDPLTRLPNRRHGLDFLAAEWVFARSNGQPMACLMLDIDHFKRVNDDYGHEAGDEVLARVARLLQAGSRGEDMVFRYGGEEFCILCPATDLDSARMVGERIRKSVETEDFRHGGATIRVTISIGVAIMRPDHAEGEDMIRDADAALLRAKQSGRNRVVS